jgi:hypothetical protein
LPAPPGPKADPGVAATIASVSILSANLSPPKLLDGGEYVEGAAGKRAVDPDLLQA